MKQNIYTLAVLLALGLTACNKETDSLADGPVAAQVTAGISQTLTRVSVDDEGSASFTNGDIINVVANGSTKYYAYTLEGSAWSAGNNPYYFQNTDLVNFQAWYAVPGYKETDNEIEIDTRTQDVTDGWNQWDILATPVVKTDVTSPIINFTGANAFSHVMTQITMVFKKGNGITDMTALEGYTLKSLIIGATFNTLNCKLTPGTTTGDIAISGIKDASGTEYECTPLILVPQTVTGTIALEVSYNDQTYKANLDAPEDGLFEAGHSYTYPVTISNTGLEIGNAEINDWQPGYNFDDSEATLQ